MDQILDSVAAPYRKSARKPPMSNAAIITSSDEMASVARNARRAESAEVRSMRRGSYSVVTEAGFAESPRSHNPIRGADVWILQILVQSNEFRRIPYRFSLGTRVNVPYLPVKVWVNFAAGRREFPPKLERM